MRLSLKHGERVEVSNRNSTEGRVYVLALRGVTYVALDAEAGEPGTQRLFRIVGGRVTAADPADFEAELRRTPEEERW